jgi:hypothetical protein
MCLIWDDAGSEAMPSNNISPITREKLEHAGRNFGS